MFLLNSLTVVILFVLSFILPITSFLLPVYKIQKMKNITLKQNILINIVAMVIIAIINPLLLSVYLLFYLTIEIFYYFFNRKFYKVKKFDRIVITTVIVGIFMGGLVYILRDQLTTALDLVMVSYKKNMNLSNFEVNQLYSYMKDNAVYFFMDYLMLTIYFVYMSVDGKNYEKWTITFEWILIYIIPFFMIHIFEIDNFYTQNLMHFGEVIFTFFGIKTIFSFLSKYSKIKMLNNFISFLMAIIFPYITFVCGVLGSFFYKENDK